MQPLGWSVGIADADNMVDCLIALAESIGTDDIVDNYVEIRYVMRRNIITPISSDNMIRIDMINSGEVLEMDEFLVMLAKAEKDPGLMEQMIVVLPKFWSMESGMIRNLCYSAGFSAYYALP